MQARNLRSQLKSFIKLARGKKKNGNRRMVHTREKCVMLWAVVRALRNQQVGGQGSRDCGDTAGESSERDVERGGGFCVSE